MRQIELEQPVKLAQISKLRRYYCLFVKYRKNSNKRPLSNKSPPSNKRPPNIFGSILA